jgi:anti-sigma factor RsiW
MDVHDLTAAYTLDALDAEERSEYEAHLGGCERCRDELATFADTAGALAWAVESPAPPVRLRERILEAAAAERGNVVPLPVRRPWLFRATAAAAAIAACAAVGLGIWAGTLSHSLDQERSARRGRPGDADRRRPRVSEDPAPRWHGGRRGRPGRPRRAGRPASPGGARRPDL